MDTPQSESSLTVDVKILYQSIQRRFALPAKIPAWDDLAKLVKTRFQLPDSFPLGLSYKDDDGDLVTLSSDQELASIWPKIREEDERDLDSLPPLQLSVVEIPATPTIGRDEAPIDCGGRRHYHRKGDRLDSDFSHPWSFSDVEEHQEPGEPGKGASTFRQDVKAFIQAVKTNVSEHKQVKDALDKVLAHSQTNPGQKNPEGGQDGDEGHDVVENQAENTLRTLTMEETASTDALTGGIVAALLTPALLGPYFPSRPHHHGPGGPGKRAGQYHGPPSYPHGDVRGPPYLHHGIPRGCPPFFPHDGKRGPRFPGGFPHHGGFHPGPHHAYGHFHPGGDMDFGSHPFGMHHGRPMSGFEINYKMPPLDHHHRRRGGLFRHGFGFGGPAERGEERRGRHGHHGFFGPHHHHHHGFTHSGSGPEGGKHHPHFPGGYGGGRHGNGHSSRGPYGIGRPHSNVLEVEESDTSTEQSSSESDSDSEEVEDFRGGRGGLGRGDGKRGFPSGHHGMSGPEQGGHGHGHRHGHGHKHGHEHERGHHRPMRAHFPGGPGHEDSMPLPPPFEGRHGGGGAGRHKHEDEQPHHRRSSHHHRRHG